MGGLCRINLVLGQIGQSFFGTPQQHCDLQVVLLAARRLKDHRPHRPTDAAAYLRELQASADDSFQVIAIIVVDPLCLVAFEQFDRVA